MFYWSCYVHISVPSFYVDMFVILLGMYLRMQLPGSDPPWAHVAATPMADAPGGMQK